MEESFCCVVLDVDVDVFVVSDDMFVVKCEVENGGGMVLEVMNGMVVWFDVINNVGCVRRVGDENFVVILEVEDGCIVVSWEGD